ncbi:acyltransferase family protein [Streptococcus suis]|nr:acyltransferase family protein [Streptococcus suis]MCK3835990.1 acyltransferase [Streptococcus suis]MCK4031919.1 acyltransferase [Streptococcus suis]MCK4053914.1 acyltransferase [Streptococcus suis]NQI77210.1 acyltransferase family protein [Streptococcus suis]NQI78982.1 acyltransferase family protein [Streptococcus suis]
MKKSIERDSKLELIRIFSMLFIVSSHYVLHGGIVNEVTGFDFNGLTSDFLYIGGKIGANLFIMLSGYLLCDCIYKTERLLKTALITLFYSTIGLLLGLIVFNDISVIDIIKSFFPIITDRYWFVTTYFLILVFMPYLNYAIIILNKKQLEFLLLLGFVLWCFIPTFFNQDLNFSNFIWFIFLYILGSGMKKYKFLYVDTAKSFIISLVFYLLIFISIQLLKLCSLQSEFFETKIYFFTNSHSILTFFFTVFFFNGMLSLKSFTNYWINKVAKATFAIYLIHDNDFIREWLWKDLLKVSDYRHSSIFIWHYIFSILLIFLIGVILEILREVVFKMLLEDKIKKISTNCNLILRKFFPE